MTTPREAVTTKPRLDTLPVELLEKIMFEAALVDVADVARLTQCCRRLHNNWSLDLPRLMRELVGSHLLPPALLADASYEFATEARESAPVRRVSLDDVLHKTRQWGETSWIDLSPVISLRQAKRMQDLHRAVSELAAEAAWDFGLDEPCSDAMHLSDTEKARLVQALYMREHFRSLSRVVSQCGFSIHELGGPQRQDDLDALGCGLSDAQIWQALQIYKWAAKMTHYVLTRRSTVYRERRCCNYSQSPYHDCRWNSVMECCDGTASLAWELESRHLVDLIRYDKTEQQGRIFNTGMVEDDPICLDEWAQETSSGDRHAHLLPHLLPQLGLDPSACRGGRPTVAPTSFEPYPMDMIDFLWGYTTDCQPILQYLEGERVEEESRNPLSVSVIEEAIIDPRTRQQGQSALDNVLYAIGQDGSHVSFRPCQSIYNFGLQGLFSRLLDRRRQAVGAWGSAGGSTVFDDRDSGPVDFLQWQERPRRHEEKHGIMMWDRRRFLLEYPDMPLSQSGPAGSG